MDRWIVMLLLSVAGYTTPSIDDNRPYVIPVEIYHVVKYFPLHEQETAAEVFWCESRYNPYTVGSSGERSVAQINPVHFNRLGLYSDWYLDYDKVGQAAYDIWIHQGWQAWSYCYGTVVISNN